MLPCAHTIQLSNGISIGLAVFEYTTAKSPNAFRRGGQPLKIAAFLCRIGAPSNTRFPGPICLSRPNSISIGTAVFACLTNVTHTWNWCFSVPLSFQSRLPLSFPHCLTPRFKTSQIFPLCIVLLLPSRLPVRTISPGQFLLSYRYPFLASFLSFPFLVTNGGILIK